MADDLQREVDKAVKTLRSLKKNLSRKELQKPLRETAKILVKAVHEEVPKSKKPHARYLTPKIFGNLRAPKGFGNVVAVYHPGNLRRSFRVLTFRKTLNVYVGFKTPKSALASMGTFSGHRTDGFYAVMRKELGKDPVKNAVGKTKGIMAQDIIGRISKVAERVISVKTKR